MRNRRAKRFPLLVYTCLWQRWGCLGSLLMVASALLWWLAPRLLGPTPLRHLALVPVLAGGWFFLYGLAARQLAHVRCSGAGLRIQGPILPLVISYRRITGTRPLEMVRVFDPQKDRSARRNWPRRYWMMTAVAVELKGFPVSKQWLRLWFDPHLFLPDRDGLVLLVEDWMGLSRQLDHCLATYRARQGR